MKDRRWKTSRRNIQRSIPFVVALAALPVVCFINSPNQNGGGHEGADLSAEIVAKLCSAR
jgi:hypothetical protein